MDKRIYLTNLVPIDSDKYYVGTIHYYPFDEFHGYNESEEDLLKRGILILSEDVPECSIIEGKEGRLVWSKATGEFSYIYVEKVLSPVEILEQTRLRQELMQKALDDLIMGGI
jgi:hypothetical protein